MGRLSVPKAKLTSSTRRVGFAPDQAKGPAPNQHSRPWKAWYSTARWQRLRQEVLIRDAYTCQRTFRLCSGRPGEPDSPVVNHIRPHRGNEALFWDPANLETVTKAIHDGAIQREEQSSRHTIGMWGDLELPKSPATQVSGRMSRPDWFRRTAIPLTVVCGPPGAGKSTYVRTKARPSDRIICFDEIAEAMFGRSGGQRARTAMSIDQIADVLRARNEQLGDLMRPAAAERWSAAYLILTEPKAEHRQWWADRVGAQVIVIATPKDECRRRMDADAANGDDRGNAVRETLDAWWRDYAPSPCDRLA